MLTIDLRYAPDVLLNLNTLVDGSVTIRVRNMLEQSRVKKDEVAAFIEEKIKK